MTAALPSGTVVEIGDDVWRYASGTVLVGGAPTRVLKLARAAAVRIADGRLEIVDEATARLAERLVDAGIAHPDPTRLTPVPREELTVVIPVHGRSTELARLLPGLAGLRVLVVDDGTPEPDAAVLRNTVEGAGAELLRLDENVGPASARNAGLRRVSTPFVAFVDSDVVVAPGQLELLLRHFADTRLALVGPRIVGLPGSRTWISRYEDARSSVDLGRRPALVRPRSPVSWISSTCLVARRDALVDGFTEGMRVAEDVDLVWRLAESGWRVRYEPRVTVAHDHRRSLRTWFLRKAFYGTGAARLAERHPDAIAPAILRPWSAGVAVALLCARWWSLPVAGVITAAVAWRLRRRLGDVPGILPWRLAGSGVVSAMAQVSALALRHWWPIGVVAAVASRRLRWIFATAAVVDAVAEHRRVRADLDIVRFAIARRLDDIAYGAGVWWGCLRTGHVRALRLELRARQRPEPTAPPRPAPAPAGE